MMQAMQIGFVLSTVTTTQAPARQARTTQTRQGYALQCSARMVGKGIDGFMAGSKYGTTLGKLVSPQLAKVGAVMGGVAGIVNGVHQALQTPVCQQVFSRQDE